MITALPWFLLAISVVVNILCWILSTIDNDIIDFQNVISKAEQELIEIQEKRIQQLENTIQRLSNQLKKQ